MDRSFNQLLEDAIEEKLKAGGFVASELAAQLLEEYPLEVQGYLSDHAQAFLAELIRTRTHLRNAGIRAQAKTRAFARHVEAFEAGDLNAFDLAHELEGSYTRVADWTAADHREMADKYGASAHELSLFEAFHRAVARKVGKRTTSEVFTPEQYERMLGRMLRRGQKEKGEAA